ncbi:hypothetical protein H2203_003674 [Taxawa tesnikishii (nom. ined.)]|nr:hypothetical protein H2203_003674 [Dothideales sp. JES 119]
MQSFRRNAAGAARNIRSNATQQSRRYAHHDAHHGAHHGPTEEHLGRGFYITVGLIPLSLALYKVSAQGTNEQPYFTRLINSYDHWRARWQERNDLHTKAVEQAAHDRNLFINSTFTKHVELRYPETFNQGAPWNVPAGHQTNLDRVIAKYEREAFEEQAQKLQDLKNGNLKAEKPLKEIYDPQRTPRMSVELDSWVPCNLVSL